RQTTAAPRLQPRSSLFRRCSSLLSGHPPPLHEKIVARDHVVRSGLTSFRSSADVLRCLAIPGRYTRIGSLRTTLSVAGLPISRKMASFRPCLPSIPEATLRRHHPRQEPDAVVPHVRICTGGPARVGSLPFYPARAWSVHTRIRWPRISCFSVIPRRGSGCGSGLSW